MKNYLNLGFKGTFWARGIMMCSIITLLSTCNSSAEIPWTKIIPQPTAVNSNPPPVTNHLVVYLDTSSSMAGYISPEKTTAFAASSSGYTNFSRTLQELRSVVADLHPPVNIVFKQIQGEVSPPVFNDLELSKASINRSIYNGKETNLAGAITAFSKPLKAEQAGQRTAEQSAADDTKFPARFHILITDGVQSTTGQRTDLSCVEGSDSVCVKNSIMNLLRADWAGAVLGIKSEFKGKIYSEIKKGLIIDYESTKDDVATYRPFYLYIFSPNHRELDEFVRVLKERLRPLLGNQEAIHEYALTQPYSDGFADSSINIPEESSGELQQVKAQESAPSRHTLKVDVDTEKSGPKAFTLTVSIPWSNHAKDSGTLQELSSALRWDLTQVFPDPNGAAAEGNAGRYPELKIIEQKVNEGGQVVLQLSASWPRGTGELKWRAYRLAGHLNLESPVPPWIRQWSTDMDTTQGEGNKTLNIQSSLSGLWRNPTLEKQTVGEIYLRVGPL